MEISEITDFKAEAGVVSTLVYHPEFILHSGYLHEKYFYNTDNACIYWAIKELFTQKITSITALNIEQMLESNPAVKKKLQEYNMPSIQEYIDLCLVSKRDSIEEYKLLVNRIVELAFKREFYKQTVGWQRLCFDENLHLDDMNNKVYRDFNSLTTRFVTDGDIPTFGEQIDDIWEEAKARKERGESYGLPSFFSLLNKYFTYEETELVVIAAREKRGKSWLGMIEAMHKAMNGVTTLVYDSEMSDANWFFRAAAYLSGIDERKIKNVDLSTDELKAIEEKMSYIKTLKLYHIFDPFMTDERFYSICAQKQIEADLKFIVFDYIKCQDGILDSSQRSAFMAGRTNFLKNKIAGELGMSVLAFAQLNKQNEVAESIGIERNCSVSVRWEQKTSEEIQEDGVECGTNKMTVKLNRIGKCHMGEKEYIDMTFLRDRAGIVEAKQHEEANPYN